MNEYGNNNFNNGNSSGQVPIQGQFNNQSRPYVPQSRQSVPYIQPQQNNYMNYQGGNNYNPNGNYPGGNNNGGNGSDSDNTKKIIVIVVTLCLCLAVVIGTIFGVKILKNNPSETTSRTTDAEEYSIDKGTVERDTTVRITQGEGRTERTEQTSRQSSTASMRNATKFGSNIAEVYCASSRVSSSDIASFLSKLEDGVTEQGISFILVLADDSSYINNTSTFLSNELSESGISSSADAIILSINLSSGTYKLDASGRVKYGMMDKRNAWYNSQIKNLNGTYNRNVMLTTVDFFVGETSNITTELLPYANSMSTVNRNYTCTTESGDPIRIRTTPSASGEQVGLLSNGNTVNVYYIYNGWGYIDILGIDGTRACGWVSMEYMK